MIMKKNDIYLSPRQGEFVFFIVNRGFAPGSVNHQDQHAIIFIARRANTR